VTDLDDDFVARQRSRGGAAKVVDLSNNSMNPNRLELIASPGSRARTVYFRSIVWCILSEFKASPPELPYCAEFPLAESCGDYEVPPFSGWVAWESLQSA